MGPAWGSRPSLTGKPTQFGIDAAAAFRRGIEAGTRTVEDACGVPGPAKDAVSRVPLQDAAPQGHARGAKMDKADVGQEGTEAPPTSRPDLGSGVGEKQESASTGGAVKGTIGLSDLMASPMTPEMSAIFEAALSRSGVLDPELYRQKLIKMQRIAGRMEMTVDEFRSQLPALLQELGLEISGGSAAAVPRPSWKAPFGDYPGNTCGVDEDGQT